MRTVLILAVASAISLFLLAANDAAEETTARPYRIAVAVYNSNTEYMREWIHHAKKHPMVESDEIRLTFYNGGGNHSRLDEQFSAIVSHYYDALVIVANDMTLSTKLIHEVSRAGIPVIASCSPVATDEIAGFIGHDDFEAGYRSGLAIAEAVGGKGNLAILEGPSEQGATLYRRLGIAKALEEFPEVKAVHRRAANWSMGEATRLTLNWLALPQDIDGIVAHNDEMALGAIRALKSEGGKMIPVTGINGIQEALHAVETGDMYQTMRQDSEFQAQGAIDMALGRIVGEEYEPLSKGWKEYTETGWLGGEKRDIVIPWRVAVSGKEMALGR